MGAINIAVVAHQMALQVTSSGSPCAVALNASGVLNVDDHAGARRFYENFTGLQATLTGSETTLTTGSLEGTLANSCLGTVQFHTETPVQFPADSECPTAGAITVTRGDGTDGRIRFSTSGVGFDFNADAIVDLWVPNCAVAAQCSG
jgi:hypothetical protein